MNFPPEEIIKPYIGKINYELIILWMLYNNDTPCTWSDLQVDGVIKRSTLSNKLRSLLERGYVEKQDFNQYIITKEGESRFYELSQPQTMRTLSYPPDIILRRRNYDHWIIWMAYNNNFCRWADFLEEPLKINQSSLSKNINKLLADNLIFKEDKEYRITRAGKSRYSEILREYDLDRQSILEAESIRIKEVTKETIKFFHEYGINDNELRFRFLNYLLKLPYDIKERLDDSEVIQKTLLFLAINHPDNYPEFISTIDFVDKYDLKEVKFNYYLSEITEEQKPTNYFKLKADGDNYYYFQTNEKLERILSAVVEEHITKDTYLNNLFDEIPEESFELTLDSVVETILDEICGVIFDKGLRNSLKTFIPEYISYLAYKVEKERKLVDVYDKLKGLIFQEILSYKEEETSLIDFNSYEKSIRQIDHAINLNPEELSLYQSKEHVLLYFNRYDELLAFLDEMLKIFPKEEKDIMIKKAYIFKEKRNLEEGLNIINELIEDYPEDKNLLNYKVYWLQYLNKEKEAIELIKQLINEDPNNGIYHDTFGEILMAFQDYTTAIAEFQSAIKMSSREWFIYQSYIKLGICHKELGEYELASKNLMTGISQAERSKGDRETKQNWLAIGNLFVSEIEELKNE